MPKTEPVLPKFDVTRSYEIRSANQNYNGESYKVPFRNGLAVLEGLPKDADEEERDQRLRTLMWFHNAPMGVRSVVDDEELGVVRKKRMPGYVISLKGSQKPENVPAEATA